MAFLGGYPGQHPALKRHHSRCVTASLRTIACKPRCIVRSHALDRAAPTPCNHPRALSRVQQTLCRPTHHTVHLGSAYRRPATRSLCRGKRGCRPCGDRTMCPAHLASAAPMHTGRHPQHTNPTHIENPQQPRPALWPNPVYSASRDTAATPVQEVLAHAALNTPQPPSPTTRNKKERHCIAQQQQRFHPMCCAPVTLRLSLDQM